jgi:NAD(P)H-dependent flavin oxidoreductase YrpB (nitropropane dioxygenase family)
LARPSYDYTKGKLDELISVIIDSGAKLFVSAVGVPPKHVVERLHQAGVLYMNMIGHPKHVQKCLDVGVDMICAQGGEGGGHTGDVPTTILIPTVAELVKGKKSPMTGEQVQVIAAGGLFNGQSLAASLMLGAGAVWIGTRFVLSEEAGAPEAHQEAVRTSGFDDNVRTIIFTVRSFLIYPSFLYPSPRGWFQRLNLTGSTTARPQQRLHSKLGREPGARNQRTHQQGHYPRGT